MHAATLIASSGLASARANSTPQLTTAVLDMLFRGIGGSLTCVARLLLFLIFNDFSQTSYLRPVNGVTDRQTDRQMLDRFINPAPRQTLRAVSSISFPAIALHADTA